MDFDLTDTQWAVRSRARRFAVETLDPVAAEIDRGQTTPASILEAMGSGGWLGAALPARWGGGELDPVSYGLATEEVGRACSSVRSLMTVHNMAAQALVRFGTAEQQARWLPLLCTGERKIAFALTEPEAGSAAGDIRTTAEETAGGYLLTGIKTWITYGQTADLFLVIARAGDHPTAFVVERDMAGVLLEPITEVLGTRGSMLARMQLNRVKVPMANRLGALGAGISFVANTVLDHGRFSVAWGAAAIARACLVACGSYAEHRKQGGGPLIEYQLIRRQLTDMLVHDTTARALCYRSARFRQARDPRAAAETALAKYHAADAALKAATAAVKLHGGNGCAADFPVARYLRDATVLGIIEGTQEMHQIALASYALRKADAEH
jgi:alkylation response protein AidB-like acyl-CoA dehydrogenase